MRKFLGVTGFAAALLAPAAMASNCPNITCTTSYRQVNISGATLFRDFFNAPANTNDWIDANGDGCSGYLPPLCPTIQAQQLALTNVNDPNNWWVVQYRGVGSGNGVQELINFGVSCDLPESVPAEALSNINRVTFSSSTSGDCTEDNDGDGINNMSSTTVCPCSIDIAVTDVPTSWWLTIGSEEDCVWNNKPGQFGYGLNSHASLALPNTCNTPGPRTNQLITATGGLNLIDTQIAIVPIAIIANRGVGKDTLKYTEMQHLWVTGRMPSGENLAAGTRDAGSGTRNGCMNSLGIDPSFGVGDNEGGETDTTTGTASTNLGPCHRTTTLGSGSHVENATQQRRLAVGYSGIAGSTAAAADANNGLYEILSVIKDIDGDGDGFIDSAVAVRPTLGAVLDNANPTTGYQIGAPETFTTIGDPFETNSGSPNYMMNQNAADYIRNIQFSIDQFVAGPTGQDVNFSPAQYLANTFILVGAVDAVQNVFCPTDWEAVTPNQGLQDYIRANGNWGVAALPKDGIVTPGYGTKNTAGKVPNRGSAYSYRSGGVGQTIASGLNLARRNRTQGDFNYDDKRDINDINKMMDAFQAGAANYDEPGAPLPPPSGVSDPGNQVADVIIVDVIGDFDGNGSFDTADVRYFADGLALDPITGKLNRQTGFTNVDTRWQTLTGNVNFFGTTWSNGATYAAGDSRFDVTGSATGARRGAAPTGANGVIDINDYNYVLANFGSWSNLNDACRIDLSCDMNGDMVVNQADADLIGIKLGLTCPNNHPGCDNSDIFPAGGGDCNVDLSDLGVVLSNFNPSVGGRTRDQGDIFPLAGGDGFVNLSDLGQVLADFGTDCR